MSPELVGIIGLVLLLIMLFCRIWLGAVMIIIGFLGFAYLNGFDAAMVVVGRNPHSTFSNYSITAIPMFMLMGAVVSNGRLAEDMFDVAYKWFGRMPGGLAIASVVSCVGFGAVSGNEMATVAIMGKMALPEMVKRGYNKSLAAGTLAAASTIDSLIPPSMAFMMYGIITDQSIGKLFMAGIIPGIIQGLVYIIVIFLMCRFKPGLAPIGPKTSLKTKVISLKNTWTIIVLFLLVMGGIYSGIFTPTEAGAIGAFGAFIICIIQRRFTWHVVKNSVLDTAQMTAMMGLLIAGVFIIMRFLSVSELPFAVSNFVTEISLSKWMVLVAIIFLYLILGCFMDVITSILLTSPIIFPVIFGLGFDPIWFGVIMVKLMGIGELTPPVGMQVFVLSAVTGMPVGTIFRGVMPFLISEVFQMALLIAVPSISLFLPNLM